MVTDEDVDVVAARLRAWSAALGELSEADACRRLLTVLDAADGEAFRQLVDSWELPGGPGCIEIVDTITRFVHTGDYEIRETCSFPTILRPLSPSTTSGRGYRLPDGRVLWLTEAEWWELFDRAAHDDAWRAENHALLVALGILICTLELVPTIQRFDVDKRYRICNPDRDPRTKS